MKTLGVVVDFDKKILFNLCLVIAFIYGGAVNIEKAHAESADAAPVVEGERLYDKGEYEEARKTLEAFIAADPNSSSQRKANHLLALSYYAAGDTQRAIDIWERLLGEDKSGSLGFRMSYNLALAYTRLGDIKKTYECLAKIPMEVVLEQDAVGRRAYVELAAQTASGMGQHEAAVLSYVSGLTLLPDSASREALLGEIGMAARQLPTKDSVIFTADKITDDEAKQRVLASMEENPNLKVVEEPKADEQKVKAKEEAAKGQEVADSKIFRLTPGLGLAQMSYSQTALSSLSITAWTFSASAHVKLDSNWRILGDGLIYLVPLRVSGNETSTRLLRLALGGGYDFNISDTWTSRAALTYEYGSLLTPDKKYGFQNLSGPQFAYSGDYRIDPGNQIGGRVFGSLYNNDSKVLTTNNYKVGLGLKYAVKYSDDLPPLNIAADFSNYTLNFSNSSAKGQVFDLMFSTDLDFAL